MVTWSNNILQHIMKYHHPIVDLIVLLGSLRSNIGNCGCIQWSKIIGLRISGMANRHLVSDSLSDRWTTQQKEPANFDTHHFSSKPWVECPEHPRSYVLLGILGPKGPGIGAVKLQILPAIWYTEWWVMCQIIDAGYCTVYKCLFRYILKL